MTYTIFQLFIVRCGWFGSVVSSFDGAYHRLSILRGCQAFHIQIRPHTALDGRTSAEAAGIQVKRDNKWLTLIQNASRGKRMKDGERYIH